MPSGNILIPNIGRKISALLRRLKLEPEDQPRKFLARVGTNKHRYFTAAQTADGNTVAFYARLHANPDAQRKFLTEIAVLQRLNRLPYNFARTAPRLFESKRAADFEWFTRELVGGQPLGHSRQLGTRLPSGVITQLAQTIAGIGQFPPARLRIRLTAFNPDNYRIDRQCFGLAQQRTLPATTCHGIAQLVASRRAQLEAENRYLSHGDLNLGNIIVDRGHVRIVDWELTQRNNLAYDVGYLWVHLWQAPRVFRQQLLRTYLRLLPPNQRRMFRRLLPVVVAYLAVGGVPYREHRREPSAVLRRRQHYHVQLLQNCLKGFNRLINT